MDFDQHSTGDGEADAPSTDAGFDLEAAIGEAIDEIEAAPEAPESEPVNEERGDAPAEEAPAEPDVSREAEDRSDDLRLAEGVRGILTEDVRRQLQASGLNEVEGLAHLVELNRIATREPARYLTMVAEHVRQAGIDPAEALGLAASAEEGEDRNARLGRELAAMKQAFASFRSETLERTRADALAAAEDQIRAFGEAADEAGRPRRAHMAALEPVMARLIASGEAQSLEEAYDQAQWMVPQVRDALIAERDSEAARAIEAKTSLEARDAARAARSNIRAHAGPSRETRSIRTPDDAILAAMDEVGF